MDLVEQYPFSVSSGATLPIRLPEHVITGTESNKLSWVEQSEGWWVRSKDAVRNRKASDNRLIRLLNAA